MTFAAQMRVGSLEMLAALALFGGVAARMRARPARQEQAQSASPSRIELEIHEPGANRRVEAALPLVVGRSSQAQLTLADAEVSRRHAKLEADRGIVYLSDLRSSNGTFLNGERITESIEVRPGDQIDVGSTRMTVLEAGRWK